MNWPIWPLRIANWCGMDGVCSVEHTGDGLTGERGCHKRFSLNYCSFINKFMSVEL